MPSAQLQRGALFYEGWERFAQGCRKRFVRSPSEWQKKTAMIPWTVSCPLQKSPRAGSRSSIPHPATPGRSGGAASPPFWLSSPADRLSQRSRSTRSAISPSTSTACALNRKRARWRMKCRRSSPCRSNTSENWLPVNPGDYGLDLIMRVYAPELERYGIWSPPRAERIE